MQLRMRFTKGEIKISRHIVYLLLYLLILLATFIISL